MSKGTRIISKEEFAEIVKPLIEAHIPARGARPNQLIYRFTFSDGSTGDIHAHEVRAKEAHDVRRVRKVDAGAGGDKGSQKTKALAAVWQRKITRQVERMLKGDKTDENIATLLASDTRILDPDTGKEIQPARAQRTVAKFVAEVRARLEKEGKIRPKK